MKFEDVEKSRQLYNEKITEVKDLRERAKLYAQYKKDYKAYFVNYQLQAFFSDIEYNHNLGIDAFTLNRTVLIDTGDTYYSNDLVKGKYKDIGFTQSDVEIIKNYDEPFVKQDPISITSRSDIAFKGRFLIFEFPKKVLKRVAILPFGAKSFFVDPIVKTGLKLIETESIIFSRLFNVYTEDGFEAFYILDPAFIESVEHFSDRYCYKIALYFMNNKMFVGINDGNDSFEPPEPALRLDETKERAKVVEDMKLIIDIVDSLKLL